MNGLKLFGQEISHIWKDKKILIPIIAILFIPLIYSGMFLWSFKDPYAKMDELPVAVVNSDEGAMMDGKILTIGKNLVEDLKENKAFDFRFVSEKKAKRGLEDLTYYMIIKIPNDFSENATTLLKEQPSKLTLEYIPNDSYNFLASQIGETVVNKIQASVQAGVSKVYAETMFNTAVEMADGFQSSSTGAKKINNGAKKLTDGSAELKTNLEILASKAVEFEKVIQTAKSGTTDVADGAKQLAVSLGQLNEAGNQLNNASQFVQKGVENLTDGISTTRNGIDKLNKNAPQLVGGIEQLQKGLTEFQTQLPMEMGQTIGAGLEKSAVKMNEGLDTLQQSIVDGIEKQLAPTVINELTKTQQDMYKLLMNEKLSSEQKIAMLKSQLESSSSNLENINTGFKQVINSINAGFETYQSEVNKQITSSTAHLTEMIKNGVEPTFNELYQGVTKIYLGQVDLQDGIKQLADGSTKLVNGANQLISGQQQYVDNMNVFTEKLNEAKIGAERLMGGSSALVGGMDQFANATTQLTMGTEKLAVGAEELTNGMNELQDGTNELSTKLKEAADETYSLHPNEQTYEMMASPVEMQTTHVNEVPNYGTGFAPYFISLGLFVGALLLTIIFPLEKSAGNPKNGLSWFSSKFAVMAFVGVIQAIFTALIVLYAINISVKNVPLFILFTIITSITFIALIQFLVTFGKNPGRFIAILILILQLTSSAGTFPLEVIPKFIQWFNPILPMTYSVRGLKAVISSGDYSYMWQNAGILFIYLGISMVLTLGYFMLKFETEHKSSYSANQQRTAEIN
ncbi:YhgE/Pip domain-containing protein [Bacillus kwashiorkori]|uniref:YhgE/Pip domain-containing protein n=1 Tax=Bacillus kwashiorkori TaxID=1522318 RepID=UPI00078503B9|nr:YhgE/Pip domain-containing protein [Bacillus kwashiorkori]